MKTVILIIFVVLMGWVQVLFPAQIAPWHIIPDSAMLITFGLALYYEPAEQVVWYGLLAGLAIDLWLPSTFGTWSLACIIVVLTTRIIHTRLLPQSNWVSIITTAALALGAGLLLVAVRVDLVSGLSVFGTGLLRTYLPRLLLDLVLVLPTVALIRSVLRTLRVTGDTSRIEPHGVRR